MSNILEKIDLCLETLPGFFLSKILLHFLLNIIPIFV